MSVMLRYAGTLVWMSHEIIHRQVGLSVVPEVEVFLALNINVAFLTVQKDISRLETSILFFTTRPAIPMHMHLPRIA